MAASDARPVPKKNTAFRWYFVILDADGDPVTGASSLDSEVSIDGASFSDCTNEATEIGSTGIYYLDLTSGEMNGDAICVQVKTGTAGAKTTVGVFYPEEAGDIRVDVTQFGGTNLTATGGRPEVNVSHWKGTAAATVDTNGYPVVTIKDGTGAGEIALTAGAVDAVTTVTGVTNTVNANVVQVSGDSAAADNLEAEFDGTGYLSYLRRNTAQAGASGSITLDASASATDDLYNGQLVSVIGGTGAGQTRLITDYVGSTKVATISPNWTTNPSSDSVFLIHPQGRSDVGLWLGSAPSALQSGRVDAYAGAMATGVIAAASFAAGAIDASAVATGAIDAAALATDAVDEIRDGVWAKAMTELASVPGVTASVLDAMRWLFLLSRNKITQTSSTQTLRNDADDANVATAAVSDDGTTFTRAEWA